VHGGHVDVAGSLPTAFTGLVGCRVPIQLAPMGGGVVTPQLAIAVSRVGGLGMLQRADAVPLADRIAQLEQAGATPFGVNFVLHQSSPVDRAEVELAAAHARLVEFFWADPDPHLVELVHGAGALAGWQVGSVQEARQAADAGCDLIVTQGVEAGGHVRGRVALLPLLAGVLDAVAVPVLAAGGIACARSMAAALAAGAAGVRVGTRFLATHESGAHPDYVAALLAADGEETVLTEAFAVGWPNAPHRVLRSALAAAQAFPGELVGTAQFPAGSEPLPRLSARTPSRSVTGTVAAMAQYAGQGVGQVTRVTSAAQVVADLAQGAERLLRQPQGGLSGR
jgi:NAD(P)H-dependent flavin oxidoreductase YrpB (nitropropane dioxygenase family)